MPSSAPTSENAWRSRCSGHGRPSSAVTASRRWLIQLHPETAAAVSASTPRVPRSATTTWTTSTTSRLTGWGSASARRLSTWANTLWLEDSTNPTADTASISSGTRASTVKNVTAAARWSP